MSKVKISTFVESNRINDDLLFDHIRASNEYAAEYEKYREKLKTSIETFNFGIYLGEAAETGELIYSTIRTIIKSANELRRGEIPSALSTIYKGLRRNKRKFRALRKKSSGTYLAIQFGYMQLWTDINDLLKLIDGLSLLEPKIIIDGSFKLQSEDVAYLITQQLETPEGVILKVNECSIRCNYKQYLRVSSLKKFILTALGLNDLIRTAWEIFPLSFVLDWFVNVKEMLTDKSLSNMGLSVDAYSYSAKVDVSMRAHYGTTTRSFPLHYYSRRNEDNSTRLIIDGNEYTPPPFLTEDVVHIQQSLKFGVRLNSGKLVTLAALADVIRR